MFKLFKNKTKKNLKNIDSFPKAIKTIEFFISIYDWDKSSWAIEEIKSKEMSSYNELIENLDSEELSIKSEKEKQKQQKIFKQKMEKLKQLEEKLEKEKEKYDTKREKERFKVRFKAIKDEINKLIKTYKADDALDLLTKFLDENKEKSIVINFYNKEKKIILKNIEKQRKREKEKLKNNAKLEALKLIWKNADEENLKDKKKKEKKSFIQKIKEKINFYAKVKEKIRNKKLLDEISLLIEEDNKVKNDVASNKLENMHKWLIKEIHQENINWYTIFWKILWAHKISWDAFGFSESKEKYDFYIWDATGHWIRAWFIVTLLTRLFNEHSLKKDVKSLVYEINNWLKQDLKSRNFITAIFFEIFKSDISKIKYVWMWHEPMLIYRKGTKTVEKIIPWWLAAWIRLMTDVENVKVKEFDMEDWDIIMTYSDWIVEVKWKEGEFYWLERLKNLFLEYASMNSDINTIYESILQDIKYFKWWTHFNDDVTLLLIKRDANKDIVNEKSEFIDELKKEKKLTTSDIKRVAWKNKYEIEKELEKIANEKKLKTMIKSLENLYLTWEVLKLKQEAKRMIMDWYIDKKINYYLKKAMENEETYKIKQKEQRISNKYNVLKELMKKEDYSTVINEVQDIISKDWNI